jgi:hypothetical protein
LWTWASPSTIGTLAREMPSRRSLASESTWSRRCAEQSSGWTVTFYVRWSAIDDPLWHSTFRRFKWQLGTVQGPHACGQAPWLPPSQ